MTIDVSSFLLGIVLAAAGAVGYCCGHRQGMRCAARGILAFQKVRCGDTSAESFADDDEAETPAIVH